MPKCKSCGKKIVWIRTHAGSAMPCDAEQVYYRYTYGGKHRIVTPNGEVLACELMDGEKDDLSRATGVGYVPHWSTCPNADRHRKRV